MDIFLSSVAKDLKDERQAVVRQILKLGDRLIGMESFGASPEPPLEECLAKLAEADLMILILGPSYGSIHAGTGISYTENEFRYAQKAGIDVLAFAVEMLDDKILAANDAASATKYQAFVKSVGVGVTYEVFDNPDKLAAGVSAAIANYKSKRGELGRRLSPFATVEDYFSSLLDPNKYFNHTWTLAGRQEVLDELQEFAASPAKVGMLYGAGGLGKSKVLFEFANKFDERATGWNLRFLRAAVPLGSDFARGLPAHPCIVGVQVGYAETGVEEVPPRFRAPISESAQWFLTQQCELLSSALTRQLNLMLRLRQCMSRLPAGKPDLRQKALAKIAIEDDSAVPFADFPGDRLSNQ